MKKILLIDAFGLIFRAYYALIKRPLSTSSGVPTSAIYGFWKMVFRSLKEITPDETVIAFDSPGKSFRKEIYDAYKANREEAPEDLKTQIRAIVEMTQECGFPHLAVPGLEADDLIGFLAKKFAENGDQVYVLSSDKDLSQLVSDRIFMAAPEKGIQELNLMNREKVLEKFGVYPEQIVDYLALIGDASDNIPGVKGIGPKTAEKLLAQWKTLESIYENLERITPMSVQTKLTDCKEAAFLSKTLASLKTENIGVSFNPGDGVVEDRVFEALSKAFKKLEFSNLMSDDYFKKKLMEDTPDLFSSEHENPEPVSHAFHAEKVSYRLVLNKDELKKLADRVSSEKLMVLDTETTSEKPYDAELIGFALCMKTGEAFYFPLFNGNPAEYTCQDFFNLFGPLLADESIKKIGQNLKYDLQILSRFTAVEGLYFDTMLAAYVIDPDAKKYNMDDLAQKYLGYETIRYGDLVEKGKTLLDVDLEKVKDYSCEDAEITFKLFQYFEPLLGKSGVSEIFYRQEMPLVKVLAEVEMNGISLDSKVLKELEFWLEDRITKLESGIYEDAGLRFNLNSPKQLGEVLFEKMGLPVIKKTKTGYSTDEGVLEELSVSHEIAKKMLSYRKYTKLLNTYVKTLPNYTRKGRIHTCFHQTGTATGRLASSDPNLQNIPVRDEAGRQIRRAFTAPEGFLLVSADYSQIELRIMAHFSGDEALIQAFHQDRDIHRNTAALIFSKSPESVSMEERQIAKSINFGIIYGMGPFKLSRETGISMRQAKEFIERYFSVFQGVKKLIESVKEEARKTGYVTTLLGHRRYLPYLNSKNRNLRESDERMAVNTVIQGSNADLMKQVMIQVFSKLKGQEASLLLQIHDELVFEVKESAVESFSGFLSREMESAMNLKVPLRVSVSFGKNWGDLK